MRSRRNLRAVAFLSFYVCAAGMFAQDAWRKSVEEHRERRDAYLRRDPFTPLALVHREYLDGRTRLTIGSSSQNDLQLHEINSGPLHVFIENNKISSVRKDPGDPSSLRVIDVREGRSFSVGRYNLLYRAEAPVRGAAMEVYDTKEPALHEFRGLEYFPIDARYRVTAQITPRVEPPAVQLVDSAGQPRPYYIYGDLRFELDGRAVTLEVYSTTLDRAAIERNGFMLIFADVTSGKESYYAGRYLDINGKLRGAVTVDFNLSRNPPCAFSPVYTCPFPRAQNRLPVAIRAGEKTYTGKTATPMQHSDSR